MLPRSLVTVRHNKLINNINSVNIFRRLSTQVQEVKVGLRDYDETPKPVKHRTLKKFKEPFPKSFFTGKCDPEVLEYPEVLNLEEIEKVKDLAEQVLTISNETPHTISKATIKRLADTGILGSRADLPHWGLGLTNTEQAVLNEATALNSPLYKFTVEQQIIAYNILNEHGTEQQKLTFLSSLIKGQTIISCAFQERPSSSDAETTVQTFALPDGRGGFEITGVKDWVYGASLADAIIVFASTTSKDDTGQRAEGLTAFVVPSNSPGVTIHPPLNTIGLTGVPVCKVEFTDVKVEASAVVGPQHQAAAMLLQAMPVRLNIAPYVVGVGKQLLSDVTRDAINSTFMAAPKQELDGVRARLGRMATALYALESSLYLQAGHADLYENADTFLESCIIKVLASKVLTFLTSEVINLMGSEALVRPDLAYLRTLLENSAFYSVCDETNINLKNNIALTGLAHAGMTVHEEVRKIRNPLMFPAFVFKKMFEGKRKYGGNTGNLLGLEGYLHPSLQSAAGTLEFCISRVHLGTDSLLVRYGKEIVEKHMELNLLAEAAITTYALTASLARASRSYCIGLSECDSEIEMALAVSAYSEKKLVDLCTELEEGPLLHPTNKYMRISERVISNRGCCTQTPITRNF